MIFKFRVILDAQEDVFRDLALDEHDSLEDLHNAIVNAFGFDGQELASFYRSDDKWMQGEEIPLFDTGDNPGEIDTMQDFALGQVFDRENTKLIYVYDFLNMWTFFVELAAMEEAASGVAYPMMLFSHGLMPAVAPEKNFEDADENEFDFAEDDYDEDDFDMFDEGGDHTEDYGFEENWN